VAIPQRALVAIAPALFLEDSVKLRPVAPEPGDDKFFAQRRPRLLIQHEGMQLRIERRAGDVVRDRRGRSGRIHALDDGLAAWQGLQMPEALAGQVEEREIRIRVIGFAANDPKELHVPLQHGGVKADFVSLEISGFREPEDGQQHARLVRAGSPAGAVDVQRAKHPQVAIQVIRHGRNQAEASRSSRTNAHRALTPSSSTFPRSPQ
jgi:hypothetical protein